MLSERSGLVIAANRQHRDSLRSGRGRRRLVEFPSLPIASTMEPTNDSLARDPRRGM